MHAITLIGEDGSPVCHTCEVADGPLSRARGLLGRDALPEGVGMLISPCNSIHTCFLRFSIDVVFLDRELRVVDVVERLKPWRAALRRGSAAVLELPAGTARRAGIAKGQRLAWGTVSVGAAA